MISSILHPSLASHSHTPTLFLPLSRMLSMLFTFLSVLIATAVADTDQIPSELKVDVYEGPTECEDEHKVMNGQSVSMHYTGTIDQSSVTGEKGKQFDSSRDRGQTFDFVIGQGQVIKGWDEGILGLCVGAKANLVIPPEMGYGTSGAGGDIPGGATLHLMWRLLQSTVVLARNRTCSRRLTRIVMENLAETKSLLTLNRWEGTMFRMIFGITKMQIRTDTFLGKNFQGQRERTLWAMNSRVRDGKPGASGFWLSTAPACEPSLRCH